ncbi:substrate-binding domain-containing protein [Dankookia sp. P2]|uniref:substrate-binding domain-containing protein n=1 Tax=Dankookia sp. P2 TaxID=3423955 RepID=UPI003D679B0F
MRRRDFHTVVGGGLALGLAAPAALRAQPKRSLAFVVNVSADFWTIARRGIEKANREHPDFDMEMIIPGQASAAEQRRILDELLARRVAGVAISAINPASQTEVLNRVAAQSVLFTTDSDAPASNRMVYIGTDNVAAGRKAGEQMKQAMPEGGRAMLFVGTMDADNARERVQGIREALQGGNIEIVDVRTDESDFARARRNAEDALARERNLNMMVGLLGLQHSADLSGGAGGRAAGTGEGGRLRRRCADPPGRGGRHHPFHRRAAAL